MWDILLAIFVCLIQLGLLIMGVYVSLRPPLPKHHVRWIVSFVLVGFVGVALTAWAAWRFAHSSEALNNKIDNLQKEMVHHTHVAFPAPGRVLNFPWWPYKVGDVPTFSVQFMNAGNYQVDESRLQGVVKVQPISLALRDDTIDNLLKDTKLGVPAPVPPFSPLLPMYQHQTYQGSPLTLADMREINAVPPRSGVFVAARVLWKDETGCYVTEACYVMTKEMGDPGFNWHLGSTQTGKEVKTTCN
jgi:hypothetical protein